jgi:signal transduction histidine kinase/ligand-binding sensor domain-containing protein
MVSFLYFRSMNKRNTVARYVCVLIIGLAVFYRTSGQSSKLFFQNYTTANGLCDNSINSITQDSRGFIWIGTSEGLSRFDGATFKNFFASRDSLLSFPFNNIHNLVEYKPGHLLFSSGGRLWCLNTITSSFYRPPTELAKKHIAQIEQMPDKNLLFSSRDTAYISNINLVIIQRIPCPFSPSTLSQVTASFISGDTLLLMNKREFFFYSIGTGRYIPFIPDTRVAENQKITTFETYDKKNRCLYFSNYWLGLLQYDMKGNTIHHYTDQAVAGKKLASNAVLSLLNFNDSTLYIGTRNGFNILNKRSGVIENLVRQPGKENSPAGNITICLYKDREGNIWAGTTEGMSRVNNTNRIIKTIEQPNIPSMSAECYKIGNGNGEFLYTSIHGLGTYRINKTDNSISLVDNTVVTSAWSHMLSNNILYIGGGGQKKLAAFDLNRQKIVPASFLDQYYDDAELVTLLYKDSRGDEWFSFNQGGGLLRKPAGTDIIEHYNKKSSPPAFSLGYYVNATEDRQGNNWFSVNKSHLLVKWDYAKKEFKEISLDTVPGAKGAAMSGSFYIYSGKTDTVWISYEALGLAAYDVVQNKARILTIEDGLPTNYISSIVADHKKRIWMGTPRGLVCYLPTEEKFITFKKENGLPADKFTNGAIYFDEQTNELWLNCENLLLRVNPDELLAQNNKVISIYMDEIVMNGHKIDPAKLHSLQYDQNNFQFQFTAADMSSGKELEFAYRLQGADADWIYSGDKRSAIYSSLNPGNYQFKVRSKRKGDTEWTTIKEPFVFTIATPWWKTWWFKTCLSLSAIGILVAIIRFYYNRRLEKQRTVLEKQQAVEKERTRIATDMHDDFGASLSRIKFLSEKMQLQRYDAEKVNEDLGKISAYSDEMAEKMGEIVWALNQRYDSSGDLVSFCRSYASEYLEDKNIKLRFESSETADIKIEGEIRRNIFLVIKESLHNVVKHAKASNLHLRINIDKELQVIIHDNGKGFDMAAIRPFANGVENMKKRVEEIGGRISIKNSNGTRIEITIDPGIQQNTYR